MLIEHRDPNFKVEVFFLRIRQCPANENPRSGPPIALWDDENMRCLSLNYFGKLALCMSRVHSMYHVSMRHTEIQAFYDVKVLAFYSPFIRTDYSVATRLLLTWFVGCPGSGTLVKAPAVSLAGGGRREVRHDRSNTALNRIEV